MTEPEQRDPDILVRIRGFRMSLDRVPVRLLSTAATVATAVATAWGLRR